MFSQPKLLVARTKRWAEAKVLADCLTVKVSLYDSSILRTVRLRVCFIAGRQALPLPERPFEITFATESTRLLLPPAIRVMEYRRRDV